MKGGHDRQAALKKPDALIVVCTRSSDVVDDEVADGECSIGRHRGAAEYEALQNASPPPPRHQGREGRDRPRQIDSSVWVASRHLAGVLLESPCVVIRSRAAGSLLLPF